MTKKKEKILNAALALFAEEGFTATSTSKIAKKAGVSEGLIFRHFENKDGLLNAILKEGEEKAKILFADVVTETEPKEAIRKTLELGLKMNQNKELAEFWKLQYKIKWELEEYGEHKMEVVKKALTQAFDALGYKQADMEAEHLLILLDGLATRFYLQASFDVEKTIQFVLKKYGI